MIWECTLVDVGVSEQRTLFLRESTEARIMWPNQKLFIGGRMSRVGGGVGGCPPSLPPSLCHYAFLGAVVVIHT